MKKAKAKVLEHLAGEVEFVKPHYKQRRLYAHAAIRDTVTFAGSDQDMTAIMNAATIIRRVILNSVSQKWSFSWSISCESAKSHVTLSLQTLVKWILQGTGSGTEICDDETERASLHMSQNIMYETRRSQFAR